MGIAAINQWRARKAYKEVRANYIPQITIGSAWATPTAFR